jgi:hypothetical protein
VFSGIVANVPDRPGQGRDQSASGCGKVATKPQPSAVKSSSLTLRTKDGKEVDFVMVEKGRPTLMIEVKTSDRELAPGLAFFHDRYAIPGVQLVGDLRVESESKGLAILRAFDWLEQLERPTRSPAERPPDCAPQRAQRSQRWMGRKEGFGPGSGTLSCRPLWPLCSLW